MVRTRLGRALTAPPPTPGTVAAAALARDVDAIPERDAAAPTTCAVAAIVERNCARSSGNDPSPVPTPPPRQRSDRPRDAPRPPPAPSALPLPAPPGSTNVALTSCNACHSGMTTRREPPSAAGSRTGMQQLLLCHRSMACAMTRKEGQMTSTPPGVRVHVASTAVPIASRYASRAPSSESDLKEPFSDAVGRGRGALRGGGPACDAETSAAGAMCHGHGEAAVRTSAI